MRNQERTALLGLLKSLAASKQTLSKAEQASGHSVVTGKTGFLETVNGRFLMHVQYASLRSWQHVKRVLKCTVVFEGDNGGTLLLELPIEPERAKLVRRWLGIRKGRWV